MKPGSRPRLLSSHREIELQPPPRLIFWPCLILMRWLLIALLVSLAALLIAGAGMMLHVWVQRSRSRSKRAAGAAEASGQAEETDQETEI